MFKIWFENLSGVPVRAWARSMYVRAFGRAFVLDVCIHARVYSREEAADLRS